MIPKMEFNIGNASDKIVFNITGIVANYRKEHLRDCEIEVELHINSGVYSIIGGRVISSYNTLSSLYQELNDLYNGAIDFVNYSYEFDDRFNFEIRVLKGGGLAVHGFYCDDCLSANQLEFEFIIDLGVLFTNIAQISNTNVQLKQTLNCLNIF